MSRGNGLHILFGRVGASGWPAVEIGSLVAVLFVAAGAHSSELLNDEYAAEIWVDGAVILRGNGMPPHRVTPEFSVLRSERDPRIHRNASHPNYSIAPRTAVWLLGVSEPTDELNAWLATPTKDFTSTSTRKGFDHESFTLPGRPTVHAVAVLCSVDACVGGPGAGRRTAGPFRL